jgi:hypothetical protein
MQVRQNVVIVAIFLLAGIACGNKNSLRSSDAAVLERYQKIYKALIADNIKGVSANALEIAKTVKQDPEKKLPMEIANKADQVAKDTDLKTLRENFKGLSAALISYLEKQNIKGTGYQQNYCPMVEASWLQKDTKINNPYYGKSMPACGENKRTF